ncbi:hypothetical protein LTR24_006034 [Lithohypha guttulata]|uniref:chitin synthase n=1 Tax=Lithohypha guttulata TaxID=1690604 RepID=A0ABR0K8V9_9EURO|nr:hypothetical protein LTR24_006034 [Lithohypha guttulata]
MATLRGLNSYSIDHAINDLARHDLQLQLPSLSKPSEAHLRNGGMLLSRDVVLTRPSLPSRAPTGLSLSFSSVSGESLSTCKAPSRESSRTSSLFSNDRSSQVAYQASGADLKPAHLTGREPRRVRRSLSVTEISTSWKPAPEPIRSRSLSEITSSSARPVSLRQNDIRPFVLKGRVKPSSTTDEVEQNTSDVQTDDIDRIAISKSLPKRPVEDDHVPGIHRRNSLSLYDVAIAGREACVVSVPPKSRPDASDETLKRRGRRRIVLQKHAMQISQAAWNGFFIFTTWWWMRYYYLLLPFITATVALNVIMIFSIICRQIRNGLAPEKKVMPKSPESLVLLIPCYNETKEELLKSLDSLVAQIDIEQHKRAIMIMCDGKVRGPGMEKSTADYLLHDILTDNQERRYVRSAYLAWDQQPMDIVFQRGTYGGIPYFCIVKQQNQGKRDGLIVVRSFLYNFNMRDEKPKVIFSSEFFAHMAKFLLEAQFDRVDQLVGMDADTVFDERCIWNLLNESRYPNTVGVCGYVAVDFSGGQWNIWRLYQSAEYTIAQGLRRLHQSIVTHKVSCLPGCCQLLKVCEETCGEEVLIEKFGYCPTVKDGLLTQIRATASEDRNHVCHMLSARPNAQTRQALGAKAVTDVPHSASVFLSQRRRWTLGATSNDLFLAFAPGVQWFERILAFVNVFTWFLNPFIIASVASFIYAITIWNMDSFGWGKTRKVISTDESSEGSESDNTFGHDKHDAGTKKADGVSSQPEDIDRMDEIAREEKKIGH